MIDKATPKVVQFVKKGNVTHISSKSGVTRSTLYNLLNGQEISIQTLDSIARAMGKEIEIRLKDAA